MRQRHLAHAMLGIVLVAGCGGGKTKQGSDGAGGGADGGSACNQVSPCGGDIVGTWMATRSCVIALEDLSSQCPNSWAEIMFAFSGTVTYQADHSYTSAISAGGTTSYHYHSACLPSGTTCSQWGQGLMVVGGYSSMSCADTGEICACVAVTAPTSASTSGMYSISRTTLTTTHDGGSDSLPYCVQGNALYQLYEPPASRATTFSGSIVFERQ